MRLITTLLLLISVNAFAIQDTDIRLSLEEPAIGGSYASVSNLRGWAVAPSGIDYVEVFINGDYAFNVPMGGARGDVGNAFPNYPDSDLSGFSLAFNYKNLSPGEHEMTVRAFDTAGNYNEASSTFSARRFVSPFIGNDDKIDLSTTDNVYLVNNQSMVMSGTSVEGKYWDILLSWDRATQGFEITDIAETSSNPSPPSTSSNLVTSNVEGVFPGWGYGVKFELKNGQVWQQATDDFYTINGWTPTNPYIVIYAETKCSSGWRAFFPEEDNAPLGTCVKPLVRFK